MLTLCRPALVPILVCLAVSPVPAAPLLAQNTGVIEELAPLLAAEDARRYDAAALEQAAGSADSVVRRYAALAIGRIGDPRGLPLLLTLYADEDSTVRPAAAFALGLLGDTAAVTHLVTRLGQPPALDEETIRESVTALARIGGPEAAEWLAAALERRAALVVPDTAAVVQVLIAESWRLGEAAPVTALLPFLRDTGIVVRAGAVYSLGRLRAPAAANGLIGALGDRDDRIRALAARALGRRYAEEAGLDPATTARVLVRAVDDRNPQVRIAALQSLATYGDSALAREVAARMNDAQPHVRLQAIATLGALGGAAAADALAAVVESDQASALRREALTALAAVDTARFLALAPAWQEEADWRDRAAAAAGFARVRGREAGGLDDPDSRVVAAALAGWLAAADGADSALGARARQLSGHRDAAVRTLAADAIARAPVPDDLPRLAAMYARAASDSIPDAQISALAALATLAETAPEMRGRVAAEFLARARPPASYVVRQWVRDAWPEAAARWPSARPVSTGRTLQDYREIARRFIADTGAAVRPRVVIETEERGSLELELFGPDAPLTVANFLGLVDRRFFDGSAWHRVVPGFVVQDGDPRGDGWGSSGTPIRDEINRHRYDKPVLGMALSGPDTGTSQWFINLTPQPHLDGGYTVFGRVVGGQGALTRILPGDVIRTIRR